MEVGVPTLCHEEALGQACVTVKHRWLECEDELLRQRLEIRFDELLSAENDPK